MLYLATVVEQSLNYNIAYNYWDDNGTFQVYNRSKRTWDDAKDVLIHYSKLSPNQLKIVPNDTTLTFTWSNRTALNDSIFIDRRISESSFMPIAKLKYNTTQFHDSALSRNTVYYYRIRTQLNDTIALYSYPVSINVAPQLGTRKPYLGQTIPVPGTIQAEDFDLGGQGVAYNDIATTNQGGAYRTTENVGIEARPDSGYQLDYVSDGEWTSYTINCTQKGLYRIDTYAASLNGGGTYYFRVGKDSSKAITVPKTGDWTTLAVSKTYQFNLDTGAQVLYFIIAKGTSNPYNIDKFIIVPDSSAAVNIISKNLDQIMLYPNPASSEVIVQSVNSNQLHLDIFDILGNKLMTEILTNDRNIISTYGLSNGLYIFVVTSKNTTTVERIIIRK